MITREEFYNKCQNIISAEDKAEMEKNKKKSKITKAVVLTIEIIGAILLALINIFTLIGAAIAIIISLIIISSIFSYKWGKFKNKYADKIIECLLEGYSHQFQPNGFIESSIFRSSCFCDYFEDYSGRDLLTVDIPKDDGSPSGTNLNVCDLRTTKEVTKTDSEGRSYKQTQIVYSGVFGYVKFPFGFKCNLVLNEYMRGTSKIKLEDINFNKTFSVYSNNQVEALVILTPTLMTKLTDFNKNVKGFKLALTQEGYLFFGMARDLFELKTSEKNLTKIFDRFYDDINNILALVNEIKDNNKVFKMW